MAAAGRGKIRNKKISIKKKLRRIFKRVSKKPVKTIKAKNVSLGMEEVIIEKEKFSHQQAQPAPHVFTEELPAKYGRDTLVLQVRDPWWIHAYWELKSSTMEGIKASIGQKDFSCARRVLRVYDVSNIIFDGTNAHRSFDIHINEYADSWYIDVGIPGRSWCVDLGLLLADGRFITILRSNIVNTPIDGPSSITDEEWMIPEDMFARLYGMGFGFGKTSPVGKIWRQRLLSSWSGGVASLASPAGIRKPAEKKFWLVVNCELIVYGATEPDARVTVCGRNIKLRKDGTFTLRFALPDGKQVIPVEAHSADGTDERKITPVVSRETK
ncbi:MAG: DUF4912 domain-containing protein [Candidatus Omnitrophica bacterium]|nr:DUF4912 domain-containing protein [Candidatus Omnitrophota bacterium]